MVLAVATLPGCSFLGEVLTEAGERTDRTQAAELRQSSFEATIRGGSALSIIPGEFPGEVIIVTPVGADPDDGGVHSNGGALGRHALVQISFRPYLAFADEELSEVTMAFPAHDGPSACAAFRPGDLLHNDFQCRVILQPNPPTAMRSGDFVALGCVDVRRPAATTHSQEPTESVGRRVIEFEKGLEPRAIEAPRNVLNQRGRFADIALQVQFIEPPATLPKSDVQRWLERSSDNLLAILDTMTGSNRSTLDAYLAQESDELGRMGGDRLYNQVFLRLRTINRGASTLVEGR